VVFLLQGQNIRKELSALRAVLKCISDFKLKSHFSSKSIVLHIKQLEKVKKGKKSSLKSFRKTPESDIKQSGRPTSFANSEDKMAESDCFGQAVSSPATPINPEAELQAGAKRSVSLTPEWPEKRPRVEVDPVSTSLAPWPQPGPCPGQTIHLMPDVACIGPHRPFPTSNRPDPNFGVPNALHGVAPRMGTGQFVAASGCTVNAPVPACDGKANFSSYLSNIFLPAIRK